MSTTGDAGGITAVVLRIHKKKKEKIPAIGTAIVQRGFAPSTFA